MRWTLRGAVAEAGARAFRRPHPAIAGRSDPRTRIRGTGRSHPRAFALERPADLGLDPLADAFAGLADPVADLLRALALLVHLADHGLNTLARLLDERGKAVQRGRSAEPSTGRRGAPVSAFEVSFATGL